MPDSAALDAVKGVSNVRKKRGRPPYRKYTDQDPAQIGKYCWSTHEAVATARKFVFTFPSLNESTTCTMRQKYRNELKQAEKEQRQLKQLIVKKKKWGKPFLLVGSNGMVQDYLRVSASLSSENFNIYL